MAEAVGQVSVGVEEAVGGIAPAVGVRRAEQDLGTHLTSNKLWNMTRTLHSSVALRGEKERERETVRGFRRTGQGGVIDLSKCALVQGVARPWKWQ